jgi:hypothetical protein|tara:strand:+ start:915 stop:1472 length:558 start_codon:yes stop_codon:yes gene_type:complete
MKGLMEDFIRTYENVVSPEYCKQLIAMFEESTEHHEEVVLEGHRSFTQVTLQNHPEWAPFCVNLQETFYSLIDKYMSDCAITEKMFPQQMAFEQFRMKRYLPNGVDEFDDHVDVGNIDTARRFLVFFLYLNDNEGGNTEFPQFRINIKPACGKMLMFPPMWTHLHAGRKPIDEPKYIIGSYLHYA